MLQTRSDKLQILLMVVDKGSFSQAAEALDMQVASVSRAISQLEKQLGVSLLNRTTRRLALSDEGDRFVTSVRQALHLIEQAEQALKPNRPPTGTLRVDAASPFLFHQLIPLVTQFRQHYPDIHLAFSCNEGYIELIEQHVDVAIRIGDLSDSSLHARLLGHSRLLMVATPDYLEQHGKPCNHEELKQHCLLGFTHSKRLNQWPLADFPPIHPNISASNGEALRQLTLNGNGIACLSEFMIKQDIAAGKLVPLFKEHSLSSTGRESINAVYYKSSSVSRRISAFLDFIQPRLSL